MAPAINPDSENHRGQSFFSGSTATGWEVVNGIACINELLPFGSNRKPLLQVPQRWYGPQIVMLAEASIQL